MIAVKSNFEIFERKLIQGFYVLVQIEIDKEKVNFGTLTYFSNTLKVTGVWGLLKVSLGVEVAKNITDLHEGVKYKI